MRNNGSLFGAGLGHCPIRASLIVRLVKRPPAMQETPVQFLDREDRLEKRQATHSRILAWRIPWGHKESDWATFTFTWGTVDVNKSKRESLPWEDAVYSAGNSWRQESPVEAKKMNQIMLYTSWELAMDNLKQTRIWHSQKTITLGFTTREYIIFK